MGLSNNLTNSAASQRQSELFAGQLWQTIYLAFSNVSLQAYDYSTIRAAMVQYIQTNYPEVFNDWVNNSEFVMIIDLLSYYGQALAFRTDLNSRENFLDTAERRESILRLARMLSYSPNRNFPARGLLKLITINTNQNIVDSNGNSLQNQDVTWNDPTNTNWYEQFILLLNNAFLGTNPFGLPITSQIINNINTQIYQFNNQPLTTVADDFNANVAGVDTNFEIVNPTIDSTLLVFTEQTPDPLASKGIIYQNDGAGNNSPNTGFFSYFKQGNLQWSDYQFDYPLENRIVNIDIPNINAIDVWVQEINQAGLVVANWTQVPSTNNIIYNTISQQNRNIYSVISRVNDQISIKFPDGRFGNTPTGLFRIWYRVSNGLSYTINTTDMNSVQITLPYIINAGSVTQQYNLTLTYSLQYGITSNDVGASVPAETIESVKQNASKVYYTQNRMVNGEDYNLYPLQYGNLIKKINAVNRTYSGQSRYIDLNDPTGLHQDTNFFGDDGILYEQLYNRQAFENIPTTKTSIQIVTDDIQPLLLQTDLRDFVNAYYPRISTYQNPYKTIWHQAPGNGFGTTGEFKADVMNNGTYVPQQIGPGQTGGYAYLIPGALVQFVDPNNASNYLWAQIEQVSLNGVDPLIDQTGIGPVILSQTIPDKWNTVQAVSAFNQSLTQSEITNITAVVANFLTFGLRYDPLVGQWIIIKANNINFAGPFSLQYAGDNSGTGKDASWLMTIEYLPSLGYWRFTTRNLQYIFSSLNECSFYFINTFKIVDATTAQALQDFIKILKINSYPTPSSTALGVDYYFNLLAPITYPDGFIDPSKVQLSFQENNGVIIDPDAFNIIVDPTASDMSADIGTRYVFFYQITSGDYTYIVPAVNSNGSSLIAYVFDTYASITITTLQSNGIVTGNIIFAVDTGLFYQVTIVGSYASYTLAAPTTPYYAYLGRNNLYFQWRHYAPEDQRIDPTYTNIMDMFVLTNTYYQAVQTWLTSTNPGIFPTPPTSDDLRQTFYPLQSAKMISDEMIWHSMEFLLLFGSTASPELQGTFVVVPIPGTTFTNNQIQQMVVTAINQFFNVDNWIPGETFYATELFAYIHQQLATIISSVVLVPNISSNKFGNLFEITCSPNQLFLSTATVSNVQIVTNYSSGNLNIGN